MFANRDFSTKLIFFLRSLLCGELSHHGQFVSPVVILELVIPNSHCFFSPKCWNLVDSGNLVQDWSTELSEATEPWLYRSYETL